MTPENAYLANTVLSDTIYIPKIECEEQAGTTEKGVTRQ